MAAISGKLTQLTFNSVDYDTRNATIDIAGDVIETTSSSTAGAFKTYLPVGFSGWTVTADGLQLTGVADPPLQTVHALVVELNGTVNYAGNAILTGISTTSGVLSTDPVTKNYTFQGTDTLTLTNPQELLWVMQ